MFPAAFSPVVLMVLFYHLCKLQANILLMYLGNIFKVAKPPYFVCWQTDFNNITFNMFEILNLSSVHHTIILMISMLLVLY